MVKWFVVVAAVAGFLGVAGGAFGAHALKAQLSAQRMEIWHTAVLYQLVHTLALLAVGLSAGVFPARGLLVGAGIAFTAGIVLFSGSLYALALSGVRILGAITPLGGLAFLVGWALLAVAAWRYAGAR